MRSQVGNIAVTGSPIRVVARETGLSLELIRAWERRYGAIEPRRSATGHRLYAHRDIARLRLLQQVVAAGYTIGQVARLPHEALRAIAGGCPGARPVRARGDVAGVLADALHAVGSFDPNRLQQLLAAAAGGLSPSALIDRVLVPLMHDIGDRWQDGVLTPAHEHLATAIVRTTVGAMLQQAQAPARAPLLAVATTAGERHELGTLIAGTVAARDGWRVLHLGSDLPASDLVDAVQATGAAALGIGCTIPDDVTAAELRAIRSALGREFPIIVGGSGIGALDPALHDVGATIARDRRQLRSQLRRLRRAWLAA